MNNLKETVELLQKIEEQPDEMKQIIRELLSEKTNIRTINKNKVNKPKRKYHKKRFYHKTPREEMQKRKEKIFAHVRQMGSTTQTNICKFLGISYRASSQTVYSMVDEKMLIKTGFRYSVNPNHPLAQINAIATPQTQ